MRILLVDDDTNFCDAAAFALRREGFDVAVAADGAEGYRLWQAERPDAVLVDVTMPQFNGFELCRRIRKLSETPLLMVSASADERYVLQAFASGADDYVVKPFSPRELGMRIRAVTGRVKTRARPDPSSPTELDGVKLDQESHQVTFAGRQVQLTPLEFRILDVLAANHDRVVGFGRLVELAWGYRDGTLISLRHHISNLRRKLNELPGDPLDVHVIYGAGYVLRNRGSFSEPDAPARAQT